MTDFDSFRKKTRRFHPLNLETLLYGRATLSHDDNLEYSNTYNSLSEIFIGLIIHMKDLDVVDISTVEVFSE